MTPPYLARLGKIAADRRHVEEPPVYITQPNHFYTRRARPDYVLDVATYPQLSIELGLEVAEHLEKDDAFCLENFFVDRRRRFLVSRHVNDDVKVND